MAEKSNINLSSSSNYQATSFIKFANILHKTNELAIIQDYFNFYGQVDALKCSFDCSKMKKCIDFKYTFLFKYSIPFFFFLLVIYLGFLCIRNQGQYQELCSHFNFLLAKIISEYSVN